MTYIDQVTPILRRGFSGFVRDVLYHPNGAALPSTVRMFMRGLRAEDAFAAAQEQDLYGEIDVVLFRTVTGNQTPRRFDRVIADGNSYTVQEWRGAPASPPPVFFKMQLRGGQQ